MDNDTYDGSWIFVYLLVNEIQISINYQYYQPQQIKKYLLQGKLQIGSAMESTTGGYKDIVFDGTTLNLQNFPGLIHPVIEKISDYFLASISTFLQICRPISYCYSTRYTIVNYNTIMSGNIITSTQKIDTRIYSLQGWIKQNQLTNSLQSEVVLLRITMNKQFFDNSLIGDRLLYVKYYQNNINPELNGFSLQTYSYQFPMIPNNYASDDSDTIYVQGKMYKDLLTQWHYFYFEYGTFTNNGQPIYTVYYAGIDQTVQYKWQKQIKHFKIYPLYLNIGGDIYSTNQFSGQLSDWVFNKLCNSQAQFQPNCHYKCLTCSGISEYDCTSCAAENFRVFTSSQHTCRCKFGYVDIPKKSLQLNQYNAAIEIHEQEIEISRQGYFDENSIICDFGYFKYHNACFKWYEYIIFSPYAVQEYEIRCADCIINPDVFSETLECTFQFIASDKSSVFMYNTLSVNETEIYTISYNIIDGSSKLNLVEGLTSIGSCKSGYFQIDSQVCKECPKNCEACENEYICKTCSNGYLPNYDGNCYECLDCAIHEVIYTDAGIAVIDYCMPPMFLKDDMTCSLCGNHCQECSEAQAQCYRCDTDANYFITLDSINCAQCPLANCKYCFQYTIDSDSQIISSLDQGTIYDISYSNIITACALCDLNYFYSFETQKCELQPQDMQDCQFGVYDNNQICIISDTRLDSVQQSICSGNYCLLCINNYSLHTQSFCIKCQDGFYSQYYTGQCIPCPSACLTCAQYNPTNDDQWKWNIRAFYYYFMNKNKNHYFENNQSGSQNVICLSCEINYSLINSSCESGCSSDCTECTKYTDNYIDKFQCEICLPDTFNTKRSVPPDQRSQCLTCPEQCTACIPRSAAQISAINPFFDQSSAYLKYSHICFSSDLKLKPLYFVPIICENYALCQRTIEIKVYVYTDYYKYFNSRAAASSEFKYKYQYFKYIMQYNDLDIFFQTSELFEIMNQQQISEITYNLEMIYLAGTDLFAIDFDTYHISNQWKKNIFSVQKANLVLWRSKQSTQSMIPIVIMTKKFQIINFNTVQFEEIQIRTYEIPNAILSPTIANIQFVNDYEPITLIFKGCQITQINGDKTTMITLTSNRPEQLMIESMTLDNLLIHNSPIFDLQPLSQQKAIQQIDTFIINNSSFTNTSIFTYNAQQYSLNQVMNFTNVTIINSNFSSSFFINSAFLFDYTIGELYFENFHLENLIVSNGSIIFNILNAKKFNIKNLTVVNVKFQDQSSLLVSNTINIEGFYILNSLINYGCFIDIESKSQVKRSIQITNELTFNQISFINNSYITSNSFIVILQDELTKYNFFCNGLTLDNNSFFNSILGEKSFIYVSYQQSLIQIDSTICSLQNLKIYRGVGLPEISIINTQQLQISQVVIQTQNQYFSRFLHSSAECLKKLIYLDSPFAISILSYQDVVFDNVLVQNTILIDHQLIQFVGKNPIDSIQQESILVKNSVFKNNIIIIMNENKQSSIISIETLQTSKILITNVEFLNNFHNQFYQNPLSHSSNSLLINAELGNINFEKSLFINNSITNSSDSNLFIWAKSVTFVNCNFSDQNIFTKDIFLKNIVSIKNTSILDSDIFNEFQILSLGGCGYVEASEVIIRNTSIQNSLAMNGGAFYITAIGVGTVYVDGCSFINTSTVLNGNQIASGGSLYIDSSKGPLNLTFKNSTISSSYARTQGGAIYIEPSKSSNYIELEALTITSVFSIQHSFLSFSPSKQISIAAEIILKNSRFQNTESGFHRFAQQITNLQQQNVLLFQTENPLIYVQFSKFNMSDCQFDNFHLASLLQVEQGIEINLQNINILNSSIFQQSIMILNLRTDINGVIILKNIFISNLIEFSLDNLLLCNSIVTRFNKLLCPNQISDISNSPNITLNELDMQNQLNCNLNQFYSIISEQAISVVELNYIKENHLVYIEELMMSQIQCLKCQYGIFSVKQFDKVQLQFENVKFINNDCGVLGCLSIIKSVDTINLSESQAQYNSPEEVIIFNTKLKNSFFIQNVAKYGGACFFSEVDILINNTLFLNNEAKMYGGSIYYTSDQTMLLLLNSQIVQGSAKIGGGIYLKQLQLQEIEKHNIFIQENKGSSFAQNIYEAPRALYLTLDKNQTLENVELLHNSTTIFQQIQIKQYLTIFNKSSDVLILPSGTKIANYHYFNPETNLYVSFNQSFRLFVKNAFGEKISNLENTYCDISSYVQDKDNPLPLEHLNIRQMNQSQYISVSTTAFNMETEDYNLDDLKIFFNPYQNKNYFLQLAFSCNSIEIPYYQSSLDQPDNIIKNYVLFLNLRTFECQLGEYFDEQSGACVLCDITSSQYSVTLNSSSCSYKDEIKILDIKPATIQLRPHFWRAYYHSDIIDECHNLLNNCQGGWIAGNPSCAVGHIGALCEQCDLYNTKGEGFYSSNQSYQCSDCDQSAQNILNIIFVILWTLISVIITVTSTIKMIEDFVFQLKLRPLGFFTIVQSASTSVLLKVFTNYLQIVSSIASFQLQIPLGIALAVRGVGNPIGSVAFSLDCYLKSVSKIPMLYFAIIWGFVLAGIYIFLLFFFHIIVSYVQKKTLNITFVTTTLIYVYIYLSPNLVSELSFLISYRNISGYKWIASNVAYLYNTQEHQEWLLYFVTPTFIIIGILLPFFFWYIVYHHRSSLNTTKTRKVWGYLYNEYKLSVYYWETVKIIQKELIILILIYYEDYVAIKACLIFFLLHLYSKLTSKFKPYLTESLNIIDSLSNSICKFSIVLAWSIYSAQTLDIQEVVWPFYVVLTLINCFFMFQMIQKLVFAYFDKLYEHFDKVKGLILQHLPNKLKKQRVCLRLLQNTTIRKQIVRQRFQEVRKFLITQAKEIISFKRYNYEQLGKIIWVSNAAVQIQLQDIPSGQFTLLNYRPIFYEKIYILIMSKVIQSGNFRTTVYLDKQPDYKLRFQPLELELQAQGGLSVVNRTKETRTTANISLANMFMPGYMQPQQQAGQTIIDRQTQQNRFTTGTNNQIQVDHQGLISEQIFLQNAQRRQQYFTDQKLGQMQQRNIERSCQIHRLKVMICITMYSEPRTELTNSILGITKSLRDFYDNQILPHQISVFVIFDGIENIKNDPDFHEKCYDTNIIPYFSQQFDQQFKIEKTKTLQNQYEKYKIHKKQMQSYSPEQIKLIQENNQLKNVYQNDTYIKKRMRKEQLYESDKNILDMMEKIHSEATKYINDRNNTAWVYQSVYKEKIDGTEYQTPIYYIFKYKNGSKLSSHMWFFRGFCQELQPDYCLLMDAGAVPGDGAICKLIMAMEKDPKLGGVCGTMRIKVEPEAKIEDQAMDMITSLLTSMISIQKCQQCEYDIGHILDKQFESAFRYIHVLPGAFSAYRFAAFSQHFGNQQPDEINITDFYLKSIINPNYEHNNIQEANMFLAEDRVLCLLLFCNGYYLKYIRDAYVYVDPCLSIYMLLMQRRRWINGSWFALNYVVDSFPPKLKQSNHDCWSRLLFNLSLVFAKIAQGKKIIFLGQQYFIVSFQVVWLYMILQAVFETSDMQVSSTFKQIIVGLYVFLVLMLVFLSLSFNPGIANKIKDEQVKQDEKKEIHYFFFSKFYGITTILGLINIANTIFTIYLLVSQIFIGGRILEFIDQKYVPAAYLYFFVILSIGFSALPFVLWLFINPSMVYDIAINSLHYIYYQPTYTHLFLIYAFCRIDDLSWGTKGLVSDDNANLSSDRQYQKYKFVAKWIISNSALSTIIYIMFYLDLTLIFQSLVLAFAIIFTLITMIKSIGATIYFFIYFCQSNERNTENQRHIREEKRKSSVRFYQIIDSNYKRNCEMEQIPENENEELEKMV